MKAKLFTSNDFERFPWALYFNNGDNPVVMDNKAEGETIFICKAKNGHHAVIYYVLYDMAYTCPAELSIESSEKAFKYMMTIPKLGSHEFDLWWETMSFDFVDFTHLL